MLEVGAGTGQHSVALAAAYPRLNWLATDAFEAHLESIAAWIGHAGLPNLRDPVWLDAAEDWPDMGPLAGVFSANVIHIAPWVVTRGIFRGAEAAHAGVVIFYGPFIEGGRHTGEGNTVFDALLRREDPAWGLRDIGDLSDVVRGPRLWAGGGHRHAVEQPPGRLREGMRGGRRRFRLRSEEIPLHPGASPVACRHGT